MKMYLNAIDVFREGACVFVKKKNNEPLQAMSRNCVHLPQVLLQFERGL